MGVIPFYGSTDPSMFEIERRTMDRPGLVVAALDRRLPGAGRVLDVGAGDGFTAERLSVGERMVIPVEPSAGMVRPDRPIPWIRGEAEHLPLATASVDGAYSTWAYFFTASGWDPSPGIAELDRVVKSGGPLLIADNLGDDEFSSYVTEGSGHVADVDRWREFGFDREVIDTVFSFDDLEEARTLLGFFFGESGLVRPKLEVGFRVGLFHRPSRGA
jgi:SAM-dependent methyltransferase